MDALALADRDLQIEAMSSELSDNTRKAYQKGWSSSWITVLQRGLTILYRFLPIGSPASLFVWQLVLVRKAV